MPRLCCVLGALGLLLAIAPAAPATAAGQLDTSFAGGGRLIADFGTRSDGAQRPGHPGRRADRGGHGSGLVRYTPAGSLDPSFSGDGRVPGTFYGLAIQPDGRIVVTTGTGVARLPTQRNTRPKLLRGRQRGDPVRRARGGAGRRQDPHPSPGSSRGYDIFVTRLRSDGTVDTSWAGDGSATVESFGAIDDVAVQADGKVVVAHTPVRTWARAISWSSASTRTARRTAAFGDHGSVHTDYFGGQDRTSRTIGLRIGCRAAGRREDRGRGWRCALVGGFWALTTSPSPASTPTDRSTAASRATESAWWASVARAPRLTSRSSPAGGSCWPARPILWVAVRAPSLWPGCGATAR